MSATKRRQRKPVRRIDVLAKDGRGWTIRIAAKKEIAIYRVSRVGSDFGWAFSVMKVVCVDMDGVAFAEPYHVLIDGQFGSCDCKGHTYGGECRHVSAVMAITENGT